MADIYVNAGVVSSNVTVIEQNMFVMKNGTADKTIVNSNGSMFVSNGGIASRTSVLKATGWMQVENGAIATSTTVSSGNLHVTGSAKETTVTANANMFVSNGGVTLTTTVKGGGQLTVSAGGSADDVSVKGTGVMDVLAGGIVTNANIISGGIANIRGKTENTTVNKAGGLDIASLIVFDGGNTTSTTINEAGYMHISNGGQATSTTVNSGGFLYVSNGGQATSSFVNDGGHIDVFEGGLASDARVSSGGSLSVSNGGFASNTFLSGGLMYASNGATVTGVMALQGANLYIYEGAAVTELVENGGYVSFLTNASATFLSNTFSGLTLSKESATVHSMTKAVDITLNDSGYLYVYAGGTATGTTVNSGGQLHVSSGGKITGKMTIADGAYVTIHQTGAIVDFDISDLSPNNDVLINNLSKLNSFPTYTLTVSATQAKGTYNLAEGVSSFSKSITVVNTFGSELGTLTVAGGETNIGGRKYTLALTGSGLTVTLGEASTDTTPPEVSNVAASIMTLTNHNVTVTADFTDDVEVATKLYKIGSGAWTDYVDGVVVTENGTVYFKAVDTSGNESIEASYTVSNIDKVKPTITDITPSTTALTDSVTVTANFADNVSLASKQYKIGDGAWTDYTTGVTVTSNTTLSFKAVDTVGNEATAQHVVTNINSIFTGDLENAKVNITSGMSAVNVNVNTSGSLNILDGGIASNTNVNAKGEMGVSSGGMASNTTVNSRGWMFIGSGGRTDDATVNSSGFFTVGSGGTANRPMVNSGGFFYISSGGTATNIIWTPCEGEVRVSEGGYATFATKYSGVYYGEDGKLLESAASMDGKTLKNHCSMYIMDGGLATNTLVDDGEAFVWSGGVAENTTVKNFFYISSGGTANNITVSYGALYVSSGGTATNIVWTPGEGNVHIYDGGYATFANSLSGVYYWSAAMLLSHAAMMENKYVDNQMYVMNGGYANNTTVDHGGNIYIWSGGVADNTTIATNSAKINVSFGGMASNTTVNKDGILLVSSGGMADNTTINSNGLMTIFSGGTAINTTVNDGGKVDINGVADNTTVTGSAAITVSFGGMANNTTVNKDGKLLILSGGMADNTTINSNGLMTIFSGGTAGNTMVTGGLLNINSGSVAKDITVTDGHLFNSGKMTGSINLTGGLISAYSNSVVDFDISALSPANAVLINNLSLVTGKPTYTLTVSNTQEEGTYNLAGGTAGFDKTITIVNTFGTELGTLSVAGGETDIGGRKFTLALIGSNLTVTLGEASTIDTTKPEVSNIVASTTSPTNKSVTVTADFTDNVGIATKQYKIGDGVWTDYVDGVSMTENGTVYFKATDTSGNESSGNDSITVSNIDKVKPTISDITPSTTEKTDSVTVTASFADETGLASSQYKVGDGTWQDYSTGVTVTENGTIYFKAVDTAGNEATAQYDVTNIDTTEPDTTKPEVSNIVASTTAPTNKSVTVTADFTDNVGIATRQYKIGDGAWQDYVDGAVVEENGTVFFKATDTSGNESIEASYVVSNIDKVKPAITDITPSTTELAASVTVTAIFYDDVALASKQYKIGDGEWQDYVDGVTVTENTTVFFKAIDAAGNVSDESYVVTNICKVFTGDLENAKVNITSGMSAVNVNANFKGILNVFSGGLAENTIVNSKGELRLRDSDSIANGVTVNPGGLLRIFSGGKATGQMTFEESANVFVSSGGVIDFDISAISPKNTVLVNLLSFIQGEPTYTLTVSATQTEGKYNLAGDATEFSETITVVDTLGTELGTISIADGMKDIGGVKYTLTLDEGDNLSVTVGDASTPDTTLPTVSNIVASATAPVNTDVFVTADFNDDVAVKSKQYRIGSGAWTAYVDGVVMTENGTVYFKAIDTSDNESDVAEYTVTNIDKVAPTISGITPSTTAPAVSVTITANFADNAGLISRRYKIGDGGWMDYVDGVTVTENTTVSFYALDAAGNDATASYTVTNIEPTGSSITGDITGETKNVPTGWTALNVNVNTGGKLNVLDGGVASNTNVNAGGRLYVSSGGIARDTTVNDGGLIEGSGCEIDGIVVNSGGSLLLYSGAKLTGQMTFASGAEVIPFVGSILDFDLTQTEPGSPALVNDLSILMGTPTYTITVDNSQALGTYKLAGGAAGFDKPITVRSIYGEIGCTLTVDGGATKLGDVYLTLALSGSDLTFTISEDSGGGIIPDNKPDDGKNDYLYKKKADPEWNNANIHVTNEITGNGEVRLDLPGTIDTEDGKHNLFGHDKDNMDTGDVAQVEVNDPAKLTFTIDSNAAGTFFVYEDGFDKKGNRKMITVKKVTVKAGKLATLKDVCLTSTGKYYVAMTAKNVKKVGTEGLYNVNVIESKFFVDADEGANKNNTADEGKTISVGRDQDKNIVLDGNPMKGSTEFNSFVGFTDGKDYAKLDLTDSAYLKFHVTGDGDGKAKFTIWKQTKGTTGKLSKVTSVSLPAKKVYDATTKAQFLDTSKYTYYVSMECSDEAKGKGVYYNVQITDDAVFFDSNDDGKNNILYDKKAKSFYVEDATHHFETTTIGTETKVKLDTDPVADTDWDNFVGYQDAADYAKIKLTSDGKLNFHLEATGDATFTVYRKGQDKKGNDTLETIQTAKLAVASGASKTEKDIQISDLEAGEYYVSMAAKSTKANDKGSVFYNVTATLDAVVTSALEMPMAAAAYADSIQDKLFGESGNGLLASL